MSDLGLVATAHRPLRSELQGRRTVVHLAFLTAVACYLMASLPIAAGPVALLLAAGLVAELSPAAWRRLYLGEALLLVVGIVAYLWSREIDALAPSRHPLHGDTVFGAWLRMVFAYWILIPSRPTLPLLGAAIAVELLLAGLAGGDRATALVLVPGALAVLAADAWLRSGRTIRTGVQTTPYRGRQPLVSLIAIVTVTSLAGLALGHGIDHLHRYRRQARADILPGTFTGGPPEVDTRLVLGDGRFVDQNPIVIALLMPEEPFSRRQTVYLRMRTTPELKLEQQRVTWEAPSRADQRITGHPRRTTDRALRMATLRRFPGTGPAMLHPDHTALVVASHTAIDRDGNLISLVPNFGNDVRSYQVELGTEVGPGLREERPPGFYRQVPATLARRLAGRLAAPLERWRLLDPGQAAKDIHSWLLGRCSYALNDLPPAQPGPGGALMTFLMGNDRERRGHCQFFASAAAILLRLAGHEARPVIGFASDEYREDGSLVTFRALHAHAWCEVRTAAGWQRFDPTPPDHLAQRRAGIDLDQAGIQPALPEVEREVPPMKDAADSPAGSTWALVGTAVIAAVGLVGLLGHLAQRPATSQRLLRRRADELLRLAAECGVRTDEHRTLSTISTELSERTGFDLGPWLRSHLAARFSDGPPPPAWPVAQVREAWRTRRRDAP